MKSRAFAIIISFLAFLQINAQKTLIKPLLIGDTMPDVVLNNMLNYKSPSARLSDFKGKLVIIDFWDKYCSVCIANFPKMEKLQEHFGDRIQILLVTRNTQKQLTSLFERSSIIKNTRLPYVLGDSVLYALFPHGANPYHVWIDGNGIVKATPWFSSTTKENIQACLNGSNFKIDVRKDQLDFNKKQPLILEGNGRQWDRLVCYSMLMRKLDIAAGYRDPINSPSTKKEIGRTYCNVLKQDLFKIAYSGESLPLIVESKQEDGFFRPTDPNEFAEWQQKNTYNYEIVLSPELKNKEKEFMKQDLERSFGIKGSKEKRKLKCLILYRINNNDALKSKGGNEQFEHTRDGYIVNNFYYSSVIRSALTGKYMNSSEDWYARFFDETGFDFQKKIDIKIKQTIDDLPALQKELAFYGLGIREEDREIEALVLKNSN